MEYEEFLERLKRRALDFYHVLSHTGVYRTELSEAEFLRRINDSVEEMAAEEVTEDIACVAAPHLLSGYPPA